MQAARKGRTTSCARQENIRLLWFSLFPSHCSMQPLSRALHVTKAVCGSGKPSARRMTSTVVLPPAGVAAPEKYAAARSEAEDFMKGQGWDMNSLVETPIVWGHQDSFKHVNNVLYIRFFETGRMSFIRSLVPELSPGSENSLVKGESGGIGVILGSIAAKYRRPVTFPDTLLVGHRPLSVSKDRFSLETVCYSYAQRAVVTTGTCEMVTYDYGALKKADMPADLKAALEKRIPKL